MAEQVTHFGDPCIHCSTPHDRIPVGPCTGDLSKAVPIAFCSLGVRWDKVEQCRIRMSDGSVIERWNHISEAAPFWHFGYSDQLRHPPRYDETLRTRR